MTGVERPRVAVVYNLPVLPPGHPDAASEADVVEVSRAVSSALARRGFTPLPFPAGPPVSGFVARLEAAAPDLVFNLAEGFGGLSAGATRLTSVFELMGLPYTGSTVEALAACASKSRTNALLRGHGIPTADSALVGPKDPLPAFGFGGPVIVKPDAEDGSLGIDEGSVAVDASTLHERIERLRRSYGGDVLVEAYLPGPEFNVGVVALPEPRALAVAQILFGEAIGRWPVLTYAAKWEEGSAADLASRPVCPAPIAEGLAGRLTALALAAFRATSCRDYARVDIRLDASGRPFVLEVNPNPDIGPRAGWATAAAVSGLTYDEAVGGLARQALGRGEKPAR